MIDRMGASESVVQREDGSSCNSVMATGQDCFEQTRILRNCIFRDHRN